MTDHMTLITQVIATFDILDQCSDCGEINFYICDVAVAIQYISG